MRLSPETVVSCPTHSRCPAQPVHGCRRFDRFPDLLIELASPLATTRRGCSLKRRNAFFKKCEPPPRYPFRSRSLASQLSSIHGNTVVGAPAWFSSIQCSWSLNLVSHCWVSLQSAPFLCNPILKTYPSQAARGQL